MVPTLKDLGCKQLGLLLLWYNPVIKSGHDIDKNIDKHGQILHKHLINIHTTIAPIQRKLGGPNNACIKCLSSFKYLFA